MDEYVYESRGENHKDVTTELRDKIKSKMDVAKFFSGFISLFLGLAFKEMVVSLNSESEKLECWAAWIGISCILLALAFSIATMFGLDRLLIPPELWGNLQKGSFNKALKNAMVSAWLRLFYPAVFFFLAGITAFLVALTKSYLPLIILVAVMGISWGCYRSLGIRHQIHEEE